jgi:hypothetical protein
MVLILDAIFEGLFLGKKMNDFWHRSEKIMGCI